MNKQDFINVVYKCICKDYTSVHVDVTKSINSMLLLTLMSLMQKIGNKFKVCNEKEKIQIS